MVEAAEGEFHLTPSAQAILTYLEDRGGEPVTKSVIAADLDRSEKNRRQAYVQDARARLYPGRGTLDRDRRSARKLLHRRFPLSSTRLPIFGYDAVTHKLERGL